MTELSDVAAPVSEQQPFGLHVAPFADTSDDAFFFPSDQHVRVLEFMGHAVWTRARMGVVIAEHGCGKSYLIRRLLRQVDERVVTAAVQRERIGPREFLAEVLQQFGITLDEHDKTDRRRVLERFLHHQTSLGRVCLLVVENAQSMHPSVLEELRHLAAIEVDGARALKVLLLGQPSLNLVLDSPRMSELIQESVPRLTLVPLTEDQTAAYVAHRLRAAGASNPDALVPIGLMHWIYACTGGVPGRINQLCQRAIAKAVEAGEARIDERALAAAIEDLGWRHLVPPAEMGADGLLARSTARTPAKLVISMQGVADREVELSVDRMIIGRGEEADVRIDSVFVSRYHALIVRDGADDLLLDLGSTNGVLVNSRRLPRRRLEHRDLVQIGPARVMYVNERQAQTPRPDPGETLCLARPGFPTAAGEEGSTRVLAFGRSDTPGGH
jgi:general secretion pathway protein A